ncbi:hypothetical protein QY95_03026 [Bacillus thermotolerans]|uniref:Uncharacterized protein n=1 Tax=Bacillus thermotolerans TaxID=1221996 RepID=A0A0F5IBE1_BACTR|nr:hypothetical protein QY95_03026 [Bacillus thermotolerans]
MNSLLFYKTFAFSCLLFCKKSIKITYDVFTKNLYKKMFMMLYGMSGIKGVME